MDKQVNGPKAFKSEGMLLASVFIIATCGILYELLIGSISSYFLGSSILQFSLSIGLFMFFMGVGSYASKFIKGGLLDKFIFIEILIGVVGGFSALVLHFAFALTQNYYLIAIIIIAIIGTLIGLEIPIVTRITNQYSSLRNAVANVLSFDYIGALLASIIFPLVLLPYLGIMRTSFLVGILNLIVAYVNIIYFKSQVVRAKYYIGIVTVSAIALAVGFGFSVKLAGFTEKLLFQDNVIFTKQTPYQKLVFTKWKRDYRLYINGNLQFSSVDEYRYHEPLVHIPLLLAPNRERVLILGGGDGLALREILKYPDIKQVDMVDLDKQMTDLAKQYPILKRLNNNSMHNTKLRVFNQDAFNYISENYGFYQVIIIDLPDPNDHGLGKLYTREFYEIVKKNLSADGLLITQATSPYFSQHAFWCIHKTLETVFGKAIAINTNVPSFGPWGFVLSGNGIKHLGELSAVQNKLVTKLQTYAPIIKPRYLTTPIMPSLLVFDTDMQPVAVDVNTLDSQCLVKYYEESLKCWR